MIILKTETVTLETSQETTLSPRIELYHRIQNDKIKTVEVVHQIINKKSNKYNLKAK